MDESIGDVWELESQKEKMACDNINFLYEQARSGKVGARNILKKCFDDDWDTIKEKMEAEGSIWYVWYMDGVHRFMTIETLEK